MDVLASDLDGTLAPLESNQDNLRDLERLTSILKQRAMQMVFVTGRHLSSIQKLRATVPLPQPDWIIANVGTEIYQIVAGRPTLVTQYSDHLTQLADGCTLEALIAKFSVGRGLRQQEDEKLGQHKLSYYCDANQLDELRRQVQEQMAEQSIAYEVVASVDPFNGDGLIDLLPRGVNKSYALQWWSQTNAPASEIIFAGDSGNDIHAMLAGHRTIVVSNASTDLKAQVTEHHRETFGNLERLFIAKRPATSGVLDGMKHFLSC